VVFAVNLLKLISIIFFVTAAIIRFMRSVYVCQKSESEQALDSKEDYFCTNCLKSLFAFNHI